MRKGSKPPPAGTSSGGGGVSTGSPGIPVTEQCYCWFGEDDHGFIVRNYFTAYGVVDNVTGEFSRVVTGGTPPPEGVEVMCADTKLLDKILGPEETPLSICGNVLVDCNGEAYRWTGSSFETYCC